MFIDIEKAHDKISMEALWRCMEARGVTVAYNKTIKDMHDGVKMGVGTIGVPLCRGDDVQ